MIGLSRLKRAISDVPPGGMQTGDPKVKLKLCDAQRIEVEYAALISERDAALAQNAELVAQVEQMKLIVAVHERELPNLLNKADGEDKFYLPLSIAMNTIADAKELRKKEILKIQAEAGRAGFVSGYERCWRDAVGSRVPEFVVPYLSEEYANRVKAGE